jgi:predicted O-linked N-acetylglucosamine transferase (SPINDLY family)
MDYIIADERVIPVAHEAYYTEKVVRLPDTFQANDSKRTIAKRPPARRECGLPDTGFVYCCFNNNYKITREIFDVWMRLLGNVTGSVLWLLEDNPAAASNLRAEARARGIAPERLVFAPRVTLPEHLARHQLAGLFLDTLPCNAHTTASDALWAGLPLLTCMGSTFAGRVAGSLLHAVGLPELATENLADYEALAFKLAATPALLADLRAKLAGNRTTHPLFDTERFRHHLESAYVEMYECWSRGLAPEHITVAPVN